MLNSARWRVVVVMAIVVGYQGWHSIDAVTRMVSGASDPFVWEGPGKGIKKPEPEAARGGLKDGDRVERVNGREIQQTREWAALVADSKAGETWRVEYQRGEGRGVAEVRLAPAAREFTGKWLDWTLLAFTDFANRWFCIGLAMLVIWMRPEDRIAWIVMAMLVSYGQMASTLPYVGSNWPQPWRSLGAGIRNFWSASWALWLLLFGLDFPNPKSKVRLANWTRWAIGLPVLAVALAAAAAGAMWTAGIPAGGRLGEWLTSHAAWLTGMSFVCISLMFMNLGYKMRSETAQDAKRRLKWVFFGLLSSLVPLLALVVASRAMQGAVSDLPRVAVAGAILMMFCFPAALAYAIVVHRAMEIRVALRQGLQYALAQRAVGVASGLLAMGVIWVTYQSVRDQGMRPAAQLKAISFAVLGIVLLQRLAGKGRSWVDRRFFRSQVEAERVLAELGEEVWGLSEAEALKRRVCERIEQALHVEWVRLAADGGVGVELALPVRSGRGEWGVLALGPKKNDAPYSKADRQLLETVAGQTALALENLKLAADVAAEAAHRERIQHELEIAREVQERLLPQRKPEVKGVEYAGRCRPAQSIGGDAYDYFVTRDGRLMLTVADICGKGVPAALLMAGLQASLRGLCAAGVGDIGETLTKLNGLMCESMPRNRFATMWCGQLDAATGVLRHVSAGHGDAVVVRADGRVERAASRGLAIGLTKSARFGFAEVRLGEGDLVAVCTDGVTEARNAAGEEFGEDRWVAAVAAGRRDSTERVVGRVMAAVDEFAGGVEQHDDLTVLVVRVTAGVLHY